MSPILFNEVLAPASVTELNECLVLCEPNNMSPLRKRMDPPENINISQLSFSDFFATIVYPIQSYDDMTSENKLELFNHCRRLYPNETQKNSSNKTWDKLQHIFKRIVLSPAIPVGLDTLHEKSILSPSPSITALESPNDQPYPEMPREIMSLIEKQNIPKIICSYGCLALHQSLESRETTIFNSWSKNWISLPDRDKAKYLHYSLNLLYFENKMIQAIWKREQISQLYDQTADEFYQNCKDHYKIIRLNHLRETYKPATPFEYKNAEDVAIAIRHKQATRSKCLTSSSLHTLYHCLQELAIDNPSSYLTHLDFLFRKEILLIDYLKEMANVQKLRKDCASQKSILLEIRRAGVDEFIAPFIGVLGDLLQKSEIETFENYQNFVSRQGSDHQLYCDIEKIYQIYQKHIVAQQNLFDSLYAQLDKLCKKNGLKYYKWKRNIFIQEENNLNLSLPAKLPSLSSDSNALLSDLSFSHKMISPQDKEEKIPLKENLKPTLKNEKSNGKKKRIAFSETLRKDLSDQISPSYSSSETNDQNENDIFLKQEETLKNLSTENQVHHIFCYAQRVKRWFSANPTETLDQNDFPDYQEYSFAYHQIMILYHAFSLTVDAFVERLGLKGTWTNMRTGHSDVRYILPGEITNGDEKQRGAFVYAVGKDNVLYHRFFSPQSTDELVQKIVYNTFKDIDFPELNQSFHEKESEKDMKDISFKNEDEEITEHPFLGMITIRNNTKRLVIKLFPANEPIDNHSKVF